MLKERTEPQKSLPFAIVFHLTTEQPSKLNCLCVAQVEILFGEGIIKKHLFGFDHQGGKIPFLKTLNFGLRITWVCRQAGPDQLFSATVFY
jgi:hypothetical protein